MHTRFFVGVLYPKDQTLPLEYQIIEESLPDEKRNQWFFETIFLHTDETHYVRYPEGFRTRDQAVGFVRQCATGYHFVDIRNGDHENHFYGDRRKKPNAPETHP